MKAARAMLELGPESIEVQEQSSTLSLEKIW
jgi:hypothetical protein